MLYLYAILFGGSVGTATWLIADEFQRRSRTRRPDLGEIVRIKSDANDAETTKRAGNYPSR